MWALLKSPPLPLFMSDLRPLARYGTGINRYHIKFVENNIPVNQQEGRRFTV